MFIGEYATFWGSLKWKIKIDVIQELEETTKMSRFEISFLNNQTDLENTFEVNSLCEFSKLMINVADGFGISIFDRRLASWVEEYFQKSNLQEDITHKHILDCLKIKDADGEKVHVKVKKLTIADKAFADSIEFDNSDLAIDFDELYESQNIAKNIIDDELPENFSIENEKIHSTINYELNGIVEEFEEEYIAEYLETNNIYIITKEVENTKYINMNKISITDKVSWTIKPTSIEAKLLDTDSIIISQFQPLMVDLSPPLGSMNVNWLLEELEPKQKVIFTYQFIKNPLVDDIAKIIEERESRIEEEESVTVEEESENDLIIDLTELIEQEEKKEEIEEIITKIELFSANEVFTETENGDGTFKIDILPIKMGIILGTKQKLKARLFNPKGRSASYIDIIWKSDNFQRLYTLPICYDYDGSWSLEISIYDNDGSLVRDLHYILLIN